MVVKLALLLLVPALFGAVHCEGKPPPRGPKPPEFHPPDPEPPVPPKRQPPLVPDSSAGLSTAGREIEQSGRFDEERKQIICFAYGEFYNPQTGQIEMPTADGFILDVLERLRPHTSQEQLRAKAAELYGTFQSLQQGEFGQVAADLACA